MNIDGTGLANISTDKLTSDGILIYKQFGFNGINYNTEYKTSNILAKRGI